MINNANIDGGKGFDWGRVSNDYAKYRDIYPDEFYQYLLKNGICVKDQIVLDIGTGTGVLPRNLYQYGAKFTGIDIAENQIKQAKMLSQSGNMDIDFICTPAEKIDFQPDTFDIITACQCFTYFDHPILAPQISSILKQSGRFVVLYMAWLPYEDPVAGQSEELVLKYNPDWTGCGEKRHTIDIPDVYQTYFEVEQRDIFDVAVPFTRESWNGRMKACRGIGASLTEHEITAFEQEHHQLLAKIAPEKFQVLHYAAVTVLRKKSN